MAVPSQPRWGLVVVSALAVAAVVVVGVKLRVEDPLSSPVIPAEDPFTHMALVREHLRDGRLGPLYEPASLYPPGMHAFLAAAWAYTGADLYDLFRWGPVLFGVIGILGVAILLWRYEGPVAGFAGGLAAAIAPEMVFRTTMMAPTALDLAILPFFLWSMMEVLRGRLAWTGVAAPLALFLVFAHPWLLTLIALAGVIFIILSFAFPWPRARASAITLGGLTAAVAVVGFAWGLALSGCWSTCGGNPETIAGGSTLTTFAPVIAAVSLLPAVIVWLAQRGQGPPVPLVAGKPRHWSLRVVGSILLAAFFAAATAPALRDGWPAFVNLPAMFGWPLLAIAAAAFVAVPFLPSPTAHLGAAIAASAYPFVLYDFFDTNFLPHRTAVYLGLGLVLLAGACAGAFARAASLAVQAAPARAPVGPPRPRGGPAPRARPALAVATTLLVMASFTGGVYAATPSPSTWYRLFTPCEFDALRNVADQANADPRMLVITGDWQSKIVIAAFTTDASRVWFTESFFLSPSQRDGLMKGLTNQGRPVIVVVDGYLKGENPDANLGFLEGAPWQELGAWCEHAKTHEPTMLGYTVPGVRR